MPAQPLSAEQIEDAKRLKAIYVDRKDALGLTQDSLAAACGWNSQGSVSQYFNGKIPLNLEAAIKFAKALRCDVRDFSPRLAADLPGLPQQREESTESVTNVTLVLPLSSSQLGASPRDSYREPGITYDTIKRIVAGAIGGLGIPYDVLVGSETAARRRVEKLLQPQTEKKSTTSEEGKPEAQELAPATQGAGSTRRVMTEGHPEGARPGRKRKVR